MEAFRSAVTIVEHLYLAHIVGGITIPLSFAMCGLVAVIRSGDYGGQPAEYATHVR